LSVIEVVAVFAIDEDAIGAFTVATLMLLSLLEVLLLNMYIHVQLQLCL